MLKKIVIKSYVALSVLVVTSVAQGHKFSYTGSLQYSTGKYVFTDRTHSLYFSNGLDFNTGKLTIAASIPVIYQNSPFVSNSAIGMIPSGGNQSARMRQAIKNGKVSLPDTSAYSSVGIGDPMIYLFYDLIEENKVYPTVSISGGAKIPLATTSSGFGTNEWDYGFGLSLSKSVNNWMYMADASYWILGDTPDFQLDNSLAYDVSIGRVFSRQNIGLFGSFSGTTSANPDLNPALSLGLGLNYSISYDRSLNSTLNIGLTDSSPDVSLSVGWRIGL